MPPEFHQTTDALTAERPFVGWAAMGLGALGLALWGLWAVETRLPQRAVAFDVTRQGDDLAARFEDLTGPAPADVLLLQGTTQHRAGVRSADRDGGTLVLHMQDRAAANTPVPQVAIELDPASPLHLVLADLGLAP